MRKPKVALTRRWPQPVEQALAKEFDVSFNPSDIPFTVDQLQQALQTADAVCPTVSDRIDAQVLSISGIKASLLASYGVGFNHIDLEAAKAAKLTITNTPGVLTDCTADLAITLMLMVARRAGEGERQLRAGDWTGWRPTHMMGTRLSGKTLGLIGMGRIARAVAKRAVHGFNMKLVYYNPSAPPTAEMAGLNAVRCSAPEEVYALSDFVSLHCPGGKATHHLIDAKALAKMQPSAFIINTARGDVIDEQALVEALNTKQIAGAGLDVFEFEPKLSKALTDRENVVLLPHLGSATMETRVAMGMRVIDNLQAYFAGEKPTDKVV